MNGLILDAIGLLFDIFDSLLSFLPSAPFIMSVTAGDRYWKRRLSSSLMNARPYSIPGNGIRKAVRIG